MRDFILGSWAACVLTWTSSAKMRALGAAPFSGLPLRDDQSEENADPFTTRSSGRHRPWTSVLSTAGRRADFA